MRALAIVLVAAILGAGPTRAGDGASSSPPLLSPEPSGPTSRFSAGPVIGLDGMGLALGYRYNESFGGRGLVTGVRFSRTINAEGLSLKATADRLNAALMADWYPFEGHFRVSAGLGFGRNKMRLRANTADGVFTIGGFPYDTSLVTGVSGSAEYNPVIPILTLGYEATPSAAVPLSLSIDAGVAYIGSPRVRLSATGPGVTDPHWDYGIAEDLETQRASVKKELDKWPIMPVLMLGAAMKF